MDAMTTDGGARLQAAVAALQTQLLRHLEGALQSGDGEARRRAIRILLSWKTIEGMELLYSKASKHDVPPEDVDCVSGIRNGCGVFCCRSLYVRMTAEDVADGLEMHPGMPWFLRVTPQGCYALDQKTGRCTVWEKRPIACRLYNCYKSRSAGPWTRKGKGTSHEP